jgi:hypothetical protein
MPDRLVLLALGGAAGNAFAAATAVAFDALVESDVGAPVDEVPAGFAVGAIPVPEGDDVGVEPRAVAVEPRAVDPACDDVVLGGWVVRCVEECVGAGVTECVGAVVGSFPAQIEE